MCAPSVSSSSYDQLEPPTASLCHGLVPVPGSVSSKCPRRRSVDVGGLALSLKDDQSGKGWVDWNEGEDGPIPYAEFLSKVYLRTLPTSTYTVELSPVPPSVRSLLIKTIGTWAFDPHSLSEEDVFSCVSLIFELLFSVEGMSEDLGIQSRQLTPFLLAIRSIYNHQNTYHNYQHALDVLQAIYIFLVDAGCIPQITILELATDTSSKWRRDLSTPGKIKRLLSNMDVFTLFIAAIGHDIGHPGLSNAFMKSAGTPLSIIYNHTSVLERMHCTLLLQLMRNFGLGHLIQSEMTDATSAPYADEPRPSTSRSSFSSACTPDVETASSSMRRPLVQMILATDMGVHARWMSEFNEWSSHAEFDGLFGVADPQPGVSPDQKSRIFTCQALLKCADISNPARPHSISEIWSSALIREWNTQAELERSLSLPVTVPSNPPPHPLHKVTPPHNHTPDRGVSERLRREASSGSLASSALRLHSPQPQELASELSAAHGQAKGQLGFIDAIVRPLFSLVLRVVPELEPFRSDCEKNREAWQLRLEEIQRAEKEYSAVNQYPLLATHTLRSGSRSSSIPSTASDFDSSALDAESEDTTSTQSTPPLSADTFIAISESYLSTSSSTSSLNSEYAFVPLAATPNAVVHNPYPLRVSHSTGTVGRPEDLPSNMFAMPLRPISPHLSPSPSSLSSPATLEKGLPEPELPRFTVRMKPEKMLRSSARNSRPSASSWTTTNSPGVGSVPSEGQWKSVKILAQFPSLFFDEYDVRRDGLGLKAIRAAYRVSYHKRGGGIGVDYARRRGSLDSGIERRCRRKSAGYGLAEGSSSEEMD